MPVPFYDEIKSLVKQSVVQEYDRLKALYDRAEREDMPEQTLATLIRKQRTSAKFIADQLPSRQKRGWSTRKLQQWLEANKLPSPKVLIADARLDLAKQLLTSLTPVDEVADRVGRRRRALDELFKSRTGKTAAEWQGWAITPLPAPSVPLALGTRPAQPIVSGEAFGTESANPFSPAAAVTFAPTPVSQPTNPTDPEPATGPPCARRQNNSRGAEDDT